MSFLVILRMFGPAGGFLLGSFCLKYYENPFFDPCVTRTDPRFIGAWWIGFLAIGFILFFINMPMFLFPAQLKGTTLKEITSQDKSGRGIWVCAKRLATNPLFMFNMIGNGLRYSGFAGYGITKPKYMESQYRVSGSKATLLTGVAGMVPDAIGILVGGIVIKYFKPKPLTLIIYMFAIEWVGNGGMLASMYLGCPPLQLGPIQEVATTKFTMNAECNAGCDCSTSIFTPICSADRVTTYFSPCYAGCTNINRTTGDDHMVTSCGLGSWRPEWLQVFAKPIYFIISYSLIGVVQSMSSTYLFAVLTSIEKRYAFDSKISGIILIADNIMEMLLSTLIGYLGNRYSRPKMIAISEMILVLSCVISALPYFIYGPGTHLLYDETLLSKMTANNTRYELCSASINTKECTSTGGHSTIWGAVIMLVIGSALRGIGYTAYWVFGLAFVDDSISKKSSPLYMSLMCILKMIGPAGGFLLGSFCLKYYENPFFDPHVSSRDPRFIGAWWIGFIVIAVLLFIATLPMFLFPRQFKGASVKEKDRVDYDNSVQGFWECCKRLLTNPLFMYNLIGNAFRYNGYAGYGVTKPKYIESQYRVSGSKANLLTGVTGMLPVTIGVILGGHMVTSCGLGSWRPEWLQVFAKPIYFIICYSLIGIVQSMSSTYLFAVLTSIEKRFAFDSRISGIILVADNTMEMLLSTLIGYLGNRYSRPRMIAISEMILVLSSIISASPYFIYGPGTHLLYDDTLTSKMAANNTRVSKKSSPLYMSLWAILRMIGPAGGFLLGSFCLKFYENPLWQLKGASVKEKDRAEYDNSAQGYFHCVKRLITNPLFMFNLIGNCFRFNGHQGYGVTKPKYIESQYRVSGSKANLLTGVTGMLPVAIGVILGAYIPYPLIYGAIADSVCLIWENTCGKTGNCWLYDQDRFRYVLHIHNKNDNQDDHIVTTCGLGSWRPGWLQVFATPFWFAIVYALIGVVQTMSTTYLIAVLTSVEKRFAIDSKISGVILIADNIVELFVRFMDCTKRLLTNPLFMFNLIGNALRYTGYGGYGTTKPKYMESQYRVSGSKANLLTGVANLLPMAAGTLAGGIGI
ncbi:unnamed protein product, partial [Medioppia subpectinata]